ncbi:MAG: hypothetical protein WC214_08665 [Candidatus Omnitrophota bacterium]
MSVQYPIRGLENRKELFIIYCESCKHGKPPEWMTDAVHEELGWGKEVSECV